MVDCIHIWRSEGIVFFLLTRRQKQS